MEKKSLNQAEPDTQGHTPLTDAAGSVATGNDPVATTGAGDACASDKRRKILQATVAGGIAFFGPWKHNHVWAQSRNKKPLVIGLTTDFTGQYGISGQDEHLGMLWAIEEFNAKGGVLGRRIETVHTDTETTPATGARVAEQMITQKEVAFLAGAVHSGVAAAISQVAQKYGTVYLNTNSSSPNEEGKDCHRVKFVWDGNGTNFSIAMVRGAKSAYGGDWTLITHDYGWGHSTSKATRDMLEKAGGKVVREILIPQNTTDFRPYLARLSEQKQNVVATAVGGDEVKLMRQQVRQLGLDKTVPWINNQQDWPEVYGGGPEALFGIFGTTWYWKLLLPGVKDFVRRYQQSKTMAGYRVKVPGNVSYNGYMAMRELLRAVERTGTTNNLKVIRELENLKVSAHDRMQHFGAYMNPQSHHLQQTVYLAQYNRGTRDPDDMYRIITKLPPEELEDTTSAAACKLESYDATPTYEV